MTVGEVAHAVDAGRDLAAGAAQDGVTVLATAAPDDPGAARVAEALVAGDTGPLRALRRLGGPDTAVLCGVALGAGERGLGLLAAGAVALAAAAVAAGVEPDLGRRVLAAADDPLAGHLDLPVALGARGMGPLEAAAGALAVLRLADAARR
jgi:NaMN:DMB phosphoribosyltransferase